jgi:hypothetical protein
MEEATADADGFVNYTPHDGAILMTGVAPSGSSKTKARREREAKEKAREIEARLARILAEAGGDVGNIKFGLGVGGNGNGSVVGVLGDRRMGGGLGVGAGEG